MIKSILLIAKICEWIAYFGEVGTFTKFSQLFYQIKSIILIECVIKTKLND